MNKSKPPKLGTIWVAYAKIQCINEDTMKWQTLATCMDTPNEVKKCIASLRTKPENLGVIYWVASYIESTLLERKYYGR